MNTEILRLLFAVSLIAVAVFGVLTFKHYQRLAMQRENLEYRYYDSDCDSEMLQGVEDVEEVKKYRV